ncbi:Universal stress protein [gamma proteobacterium HdN1]|nr:Universal stress protein [gamma proteobacterium HdN1]
MYQKILIPTDGSELANKGLEHGLRLAAATGAKAVVLTATEPWQPIDAGQVWGGSSILMEEYNKRSRDSADAILAHATKRAAELGAACEPLYQPDRYPADAILDAAKSEGIDLIVMATHGRRGLNRLLLGSQANVVVTHSLVPVLMVR